MSFPANPGSLTKIASEPFRLFFPLGTLWCLIGVGYWAARPLLTVVASMPSPLHPLLTIHGFMAAFVMGFLGTALPRLTGAGLLLGTGELALLAGLHLAVIAAVLVGNQAGVHALACVTMVVFLALMARRFFTRRRNPPETFVFLPFAFLSYVAGSLLLANFHAGWFSAPMETYDMGVALVFQGFPLLLLFGVGGFLIRSILGWAEPLPQAPADPLRLPPLEWRRVGWHALAAVTVFVSFFIEIGINRHLGLALRAVVLTLEAVLQLKIHRATISGKLTARSLRMAMGMVVVGHWLVLLAPGQFTLGLLHFVLAGGFGISVFAVATRVIFSHCGKSAMLNANCLPFSIAMFLLFTAVAVRISADFIPSDYERHLAFAGGTWTLGVMVWTGAVLSVCLRDTFCEQGEAR